MAHRVSLMIICHKIIGIVIYINITNKNLIILEKPFTAQLQLINTTSRNSSDRSMKKILLPMIISIIPYKCWKYAKATNSQPMIKSNIKRLTSDNINSINIKKHLLSILIKPSFTVMKIQTLKVTLNWRW